MSLKTIFRSVWDCDADPERTLKKGSSVTLPCVWSTAECGGLTDSKDITITLIEDMTIAKALVLVELSAADFISLQDGVGLRQYFIEDVFVSGNSIEFSTGT